MLLDTILGLVGIGASIFAILDNRRQSNQRNNAVLAAHSVIDRVYGTLIGIKPAVAANVHPHNFLHPAYTLSTPQL